MSFNLKKYIEFSEKYLTEDIKRYKISQILSGICDKKYDIVLDIGCGGGQLTALLESKITVGHIYGLDISEDGIAFAKQNHSKDNISYIAQDFGVEFDCLAPELKALEGKVSLIFSNCVFDMIPNSKNLAQNMYRLLSKGAEIYGTFVYYGSPFHLIDSENELKISEQTLKIMTAFNGVGFHVICDQNNVDLKVVVDRNDYEQMVRPVQMMEFSQYLFYNDIDGADTMDRLSKQTVVGNAREITDETTGEIKVELKSKHRVIRLNKI